MKLLLYGLFKSLISTVFYAFYKMLEIIKSKQEFYEAKYGVHPEFKARVHAGKVIMTEVGKIKKENCLSWRYHQYCLQNRR
ncbi:MAG: hypothetical protein AAF731_12480 [Bacteroidota bacterium]